jgi:phospholipid/cholesterol/gamma-HCH transport system ATP-binding protein
VIEFRGLQKVLGGREVLKSVDLTVKNGEVLFVIGTSGVGKSVLIKHVVGLMRPDRGEIFLDGERIDHLSEKAFYPVRMKVAMVFQFATLFDSMTLAENVALPLRIHRKMRDAEALPEARRRLESVGLSTLADRYPAELGDGVRKRAAIARAIALEPTHILFDEPTTGLDPVSARRVDRLMRQLADDLGVTAVVVSHDLPSIFGVSDRIAMLYQGRVHALGTADEIRSGGDPIVEQFLSGRPQGPMETPGF